MSGRQYYRIEEIAAIESIHDRFVIYNDTPSAVGGAYWVFDNHHEFAVWFACRPDLRTLHEVVLGSRPQRLKFDIDAAATKLDALPLPPGTILPARPRITIDPDDDKGDLFYRAKLAAWKREELAAGRAAKSSHIAAMLQAGIVNTWLYAVGGSPDIAIMDASSADLGAHDYKFSQHWVITDYQIANHREAAAYASLSMLDIAAEWRDLIDEGVYKSTQNFRLAGCHKFGSSRVLRITSGHSTADTLITVPHGPMMPQRYWPPADTYLRGVTNCVVGRSASIAISKVLAAVVNHTAGHEFRSEGADGMLYFDRIASSHCDICGRVHDNDNTLMVRVLTDRALVMCRRTRGAISVALIG